MAVQDPEALIDVILATAETSSYLKIAIPVDTACELFIPKLGLSTEELKDTLAQDAELASKVTIRDGFIVKRGEERLISASLSGDARKEKVLDAKRFADLLWNSAPFVKTLAVTGSVAYANVSPHDDVDIFLITERNRLWITLLVAYLLLRLVRILGLNNGTEICLSYVHDETGFLSESKKKRTLLYARELLSTDILHGFEYYRWMLEENGWVGHVYPSAYAKKLAELSSFSEADGKRVIHRKSVFSKKKQGLRGTFLDILNLATFRLLEAYLRLKGYLRNLAFSKSGEGHRLFDTITSKTSCVYYSSKYKSLEKLWGGPYVP